MFISEREGRYIVCPFVRRGVAYNMIIGYLRVELNRLYIDLTYEYVCRSLYSYAVGLPNITRCVNATVFVRRTLFGHMRYISFVRINLLCLKCSVAERRSDLAPFTSGARSADYYSRSKK